MSAGTSDKVMVNLPGQQTVMQILVHIQKEIRFTTVDNDSQIPVFYLVNLIDNRMFIPYLFIVCKFAQLFRHIPVQRERTDIYPATGTSTGTKRIFMTDSVPHSPMSSHAQSCYGTSFPVSNRLIMSVNILHQFR